jgi:glycosyltransferase involved in cell wall biosynthesis
MTNAVHVIAGLDPASGGPSVCVPELTEALTRTGRYQATLVDFYGPESSLTRFASVTARAGLVHVHGLWQLHALAATLAARRARVPVIVSAHGMLQPWALRNKGWKKRLYAALVENRNLRRAGCLHALSAAERDDYRRFGLANPIAVIPNGTAAAPPLDPAPFFAAFPALAGRRLVLFLGRIHYKKGLDLLCRAWHRAAPDAHLVLAGGDSEHTEASLRALIAELGIADRVTFTGPLYGPMKWSALAAATLFVLPSHSEGFSVAVLEAMSAGLPVLLTTPCNFPEAAAERCGWVVEPEAGALADALAAILAPGPDRIAAYGARGQALVAARYTWNAVATQMAATYDWMLGGPAPPCLYTA